MNLLETRNIVSWNLPEQIVFLEKIATLALRVSHFCCCSVAQSCLTLCYPMNCSTPGLPVYHHLPEFAQVHVHCIVMPSSHLIFWHPLLLLPSMFPRMRDFSSESAIQIRWPEYWSFSFSISPSSEYSVFPFKIDWFGLLAVWGTLRSLLQHHSLKASILWHSAFFIVQLSHPYMTTRKTIALTIWTFVGKVMSLLSWRRLRGLCKLPDRRDWWWKNGLALVGKVLFSKALIQLSADGWGYTPSLVVVWPEATKPWGLQTLW